ncbi:MAG: pilus assembly protein TadG-related protein [Sphingomicrobium sp.]
MIIIMGATLPLVIGCAGLATDTIQWTLWKRQLQRAADSAALAGVYTRTVTDTQAAVEGSVCNDLLKNQQTGLALYGTDTAACINGSSQKAKVTLVGTATTGALTQQVAVRLQVQQSLPFSSMFMTAAPIITANATAASVPGGGDPCFKVEDRTASGILKFTGNAEIYSPDCPGFSNGSGNNVSTAAGSAKVTLSWVGGVGGVAQTSRFTVGAYRPYSPALDDPYIKVNPSSSDMVCNTTTTDKKGNPVSGPVVLDENTTFPLYDKSSGTNVPTNCFSSLSVGANRTLTLPPNQTYYINGGDAFIQGDLSCSGCTIVLTNKDTSSATATIGTFKVNSTANVNISAPSTGKFKGIAIYQDRRAVDSPSNVNKVNGNSGSQILGAMYFPNQELEYNGTGTTTAICTVFDAKRLTFSGNSTTSNKFKGLDQCAAYGLGDTGSVRIVRLVA